MNFLSEFTESLFSALLRDLPPVNPKLKSERRPYQYELAGVEMFQQTWGSTSMAWGGIGGSAMTTASVVVVYGPGWHAAVYFGGRLGYLIHHPNKQFVEDVANKQMADVRSASRKYEILKSK